MNEEGNAKEQFMIVKARSQRLSAFIATVFNCFIFRAFSIVSLVFGSILITPLAAASRWNESASIHPNHFSTAEVGWNEKTGKFQVALCVWPSDLEKALAEIAGKPIDLAKKEGLDELIAEYVAGKFTICKVQQNAAAPEQKNAPVPSETVAVPAVTKPDDQPASSAREEKHAETKQTDKSSANESTEFESVDASEAESDSNKPEPKLNETTPPLAADAEMPSAMELEDRREALPARRNYNNHAQIDSHGHIHREVKTNDQKIATKITEGFRWVGFESNAKEAWLYFELPGDSEPATFEIENRVFFEFNLEQINQIRFTCAGQTRSFSLKRNEPSGQIVTERGKLKKQHPSKTR